MYMYKCELIFEESARCFVLKVQSDRGPSDSLRTTLSYCSCSNIFRRFLPNRRRSGLDLLLSDELVHHVLIVES